MIKKLLKKPAKTSISVDWFYMNEGELTVRNLYEALASYSEKLDLEIWEDLGILEVVLTEKTSLDVVTLKPVFKDKEGDEFLKQNHIHTLLAATFQSEDYEVCKNLMKHIVSQIGGFFCEDTPDFSNRI